MKLLYSTVYNPILVPADGRHGEVDVVVQTRGCDWGLTGLRSKLHYVWEACRVLWQARAYDALVLAHAGLEAFVAGGLRWLLCPRTRLVCLDFLMPRAATVPRLLTPLLRGVHAFVVIRRGDIKALGRRFRIPPDRCSFVYFPAVLPTALGTGAEGDYIYSGGLAHRDWGTLVQALGGLDCRAILSAPVHVEVPAECSHIEQLTPQSPEQGRKLIRGARIVAISMEDTDLPAGPLILLDAMAMGKAIVATDTNGTRDYLRHGISGMLVPPRSPEAFREALQALLNDASLRLSLGRCAQGDAQERYTMEGFMSVLLEVVSRSHGETFP